MNGDERKHPDRPAVGLESGGGSDALQHDSELERALLEAFGGEEAPGGHDSDAAGRGELQFGKYRIEERIGRGGMGEVFVAFDETLQRRVALKSILAEYRLEPQARARFLREARALSALSHPGICQIHDYVEGPDRDWLVLEWIDGETLSDVLHREGAPRHKRALAVAERIVSALSAAHTEGIVHRDLKPGNIMVTPKDGAKVLDFGLAGSRTSEVEEGARVLAERPPTDLALTQAGVAVGTLPFMSPEQARGESTGPPSDVFSLGLVLQEWFTACPAYDQGLEFSDLYAAVTAGQTGAVRGVDRDLANLIGRMTDPVQSRRPTAESVSRGLRRIRLKPLRRRMWALGVLLGLVALGSGVKYTVDIRAARDEALEQKEVAQGRARQAQKLLMFAHRDLREKLEPLGRIDLLRDTDRATLEYFDQESVTDWSDAELKEQAAALYQIGATGLATDDLETAERAFERSLAKTIALAARLPQDLEVQFDRGQAEAYLGVVHYTRGDLDLAQPFFERYLAISRVLAEAAPENVKYRMELGLAVSNLATLELERGNPRAAEEIYRDLIEGYRAQLDEELGVEERMLVRLDLADQYGWLAETLAVMGQTEASRTADLTSLGIVRELCEEFPDDRRVTLKLSRTLNRLAVAFGTSGDLDTALDYAQEDHELARDLAQADPENIDKRRELAVALATLGRIHARLGDPKLGYGLQAEAVSLFEDVLASDPENVDYEEQLQLAQRGLKNTERDLAREE